MHQLVLACRCPARVRPALERIIAFCTDMGTELGLADYSAQDAWSVLPQWLQPDTIPIEDDVMGLAVPGNDELDDDTLSCALGVAAHLAWPRSPQGRRATQGPTTRSHSSSPTHCPSRVLLHILHNAMHQVGEHMPYWKHFEADLKKCWPSC